MLVCLTCAGVIDASTVAEIRSTVNFAFNQSSPRNVTSPHQLLRRLKLPDDGSVELLVAGDVFQEVLEMVRATHDSSEGGVPVLSECEVNLLAELSGCRQHTTTPDCSDMCYHSRYRTIDGSCNNWAHPVWGMVDTPLQRLLPPAYEDGLGRPVGWSGGLPSAREISQSVIRAHTIISDEHITHMLMQVIPRHHTNPSLVLSLFSHCRWASFWITTLIWLRGLPVTWPLALEPCVTHSVLTPLPVSPSKSLTTTLACCPAPVFPSLDLVECVALAPPLC